LTFLRFYAGLFIWHNGITLSTTTSVRESALSILESWNTSAGSSRDNEEYLIGRPPTHVDRMNV